MNKIASTYDLDTLCARVAALLQDYTVYPIKSGVVVFSNANPSSHTIIKHRVINTFARFSSDETDLVNELTDHLTTTFKWGGISTTVSENYGGQYTAMTN